ncbi:hypothetical protein [Sporolactobacillus terrae]|uniref:Na+/glutamate symporter n=1 Tax=Sporolactobacillus terrae TaxID=269673 RepID=A0ABX5Q926_9BACL|nr:hypothetical protein [Sporolactobacillus terrae]QAA23173.1 hypothetical protein C0674_11370 [Sporolactobacillus terrae]QAA26143.1 hypothetical protein C0679_11350 [Sporolactobacillus terrae]UAK15239.1 hypothetical protein K7399_09020 [Sporolactobacillus terrae]
MSFLLCFLAVMVFMLIGEWVSTASKAYIPSVFVSAVLFIIGFWTFIPKDVVVQASYSSQFVQICIALLLVHLGTLMNLKQLIAQWKAVAIALLGVCGTILITLTVGSMIFDWHTVIAAVPPLTGGLVAALLMTDGLKAAGITALVALPVSMFITHSLIGYPVTSAMLKKESQRLLKKFRGGSVKLDPNRQRMMQGASDAPAKRIFGLPDDYQTSAFILVRVAVVAVISLYVAQLMHGVINSFVICLIFGVIAHQFGFLEDNALNRAGVFSWLIYGLLAYVFSQLNLTTPAMLGQIIIQIVVLILLGILGMYLASLILAKPFGMSRPMAFACSLTALFGFPADYILTTEVCKNNAKTADEEEYLLENILPKMLVGGFATVSIASVIIASIFLKLI